LIVCEIEADGACALSVTRAYEDTQLLAADLVVIDIAQVQQRRILCVTKHTNKLSVSKRVVDMQLASTLLFRACKTNFTFGEKFANFNELCNVNEL